MKALFISPESPYPAHGGGPARSACVLEWLLQRAEVHALVFGPAHPELARRCARVEEVRLPLHSTSFAARAARNVQRAVRGIPPLVDRFTGREAMLPLEFLLAAGPFDVAVFEHFWVAPWIRAVRLHTRTAILDLHNREAEFYRAAGGPLGRWFASCAERWEREWLPQFDQVWDAATVPTGLEWRESPVAAGREFDVAFSASMDYPPNQDALRWFFRRVWPRVLADRPHATCALIGKHPEAIPRVAARALGVTVAGAVADAHEWLSRAQIAVAPLRRGAGVSVKIAEAWRARCAVVATTIAARGYHPAPALAIADRAAHFAETVLKLLHSPEERARLATAGRCLFESRYTLAAAHAIMNRLAPAPVPV